MFDQNKSTSNQNLIICNKVYFCRDCSHRSCWNFCWYRLFHLNAVPPISTVSQFHVQ